MRKLWLGIIGLAAATTANAAVVTYTLSLHDDGTGTPTPRDAASGSNMFAIYAQVSNDEVLAGSGPNGGLFSFGVDLVTNNDPTGNANLDLIQNLSLQGQFRDAPGGTVNPTKFVGFSAGVAEDAIAGKISGLPDLAKAGNLIHAHGIGQFDGDLNGLKPATGYNPYFDTNPSAPGSIYHSKFLLGVGSWTGSGGMNDLSTPKFQSSVDNKASVYTSATSTQSSQPFAIAPFGTGLDLLVKDLTATAGANLVALGNAANANTPTNVAVGGAITVTGANGSYVSEVDQLTTDNVVNGNAPINSIGNEPGNVYVMAKLNGDVATFLADSGVAPFVAGPADSQFALLHAAYDSQFGAGGFNALFRFPNIAGAKVFSIETDGTAGVSVDQLAAVPEPATMSLLGLGALGLLARRRRNA